MDGGTCVSLAIHKILVRLRPTGSDPGDSRQGAWLEDLPSVTTFAGGLLAGLFVAHYLGDFTPLSTGRMLEAKAEGGPVSLIASHAGVQALLVGIVVAAATGFQAGLVGPAVAIEFLTHFAIDLARGRLGARFPKIRDSSNRAFWWALGLDQLAHAMVLLWIAAVVTA